MGSFNSSPVASSSDGDKSLENIPNFKISEDTHSLVPLPFDEYENGYPNGFRGRLEEEDEEEVGGGGFESGD